MKRDKRWYSLMKGFLCARCKENIVLPQKRLCQECLDQAIKVMKKLIAAHKKGAL